VVAVRPGSESEPTEENKTDMMVTWNKTGLVRGRVGSEATSSKSTCVNSPAALSTTFRYKAVAVGQTATSSHDKKSDLGQESGVDIKGKAREQAVVLAAELLLGAGMVTRRLRRRTRMRSAGEEADRVTEILREQVAPPPGFRHSRA
jgi:hypothetical protein